jgi:DNA polymerase/3'-5' exonuclease PolX
MERRPSPVLPPLTVTKQAARWHHALRQERKARTKPPVRIVPPTLPRPSRACASGEARRGTRAHSDVDVALVTALEALKGVHAALVAAQLAVHVHSGGSTKSAKNETSNSVRLWSIPCAKL